MIKNIKKGGDLVDWSIDKISTRLIDCDGIGAMVIFEPIMLGDYRILVDICWDDNSQYAAAVETVADAITEAEIWVGKLPEIKLHWT